MRALDTLRDERHLSLIEAVRDQIRGAIAAQ